MVAGHTAFALHDPAQQLALKETAGNRSPPPLIFEPFVARRGSLGVLRHEVNVGANEAR